MCQAAPILPKEAGGRVTPCNYMGKLAIQRHLNELPTIEHTTRSPSTLDSPPPYVLYSLYLRLGGMAHPSRLKARPYALSPVASQCSLPEHMP
jgi:hypothetical protein